MPKYFEGVKDLPSQIITIQHNRVSVDSLEEILSSQNERIAISIQFPGLPANSLGYIFIIDTNGHTHTIEDIKGVVHFRGVSSDHLSSIIKHAAGIKFDSEIQADFHRIRNEIGID
jgi:hypothetical protein